VELKIVKPWIETRITELLHGTEDEIVVEFATTMLDDAKQARKTPNPKKMQLNLTGFLSAKPARIFMKELWVLLCVPLLLRSVVLGVSSTHLLLC
jgi:serine/arginine repetitive matrix protein 1